jgi:hypothetical protein
MYSFGFKPKKLSIEELIKLFDYLSSFTEYIEKTFTLEVADKLWPNEIKDDWDIQGAKYHHYYNKFVYECGSNAQIFYTSLVSNNQRVLLSYWKSNNNINDNLREIFGWYEVEFIDDEFRLLYTYYAPFYLFEMFDNNRSSILCKLSSNFRNHMKLWINLDDNEKQIYIKKYIEVRNDVIDKI